MKVSTKRFTIVAMIAAVYAVCSLALAPISFGPYQVRIAEALTLLPLIYAPSIVGVTLGCFLTNLIGAMMGINTAGFIDVIIGTLATLLAALATYKLKNITIKKIPVLSILMPVIFNGVIIGVELGFILMPNDILLGSLIFGGEVAIGELVSVIIGYFLIRALAKTKIFDEK